MTNSMTIDCNDAMDRLIGQLVKSIDLISSVVVCGLRYYREFNRHLNG